uniref:Uncharacterized protein n=1 Tax=Sus scrofa TaxID=9823 RepID=A0A8D1UP65_PIG
MATIKKSTNNRCWRGCGEKGTFLHCWWECELEQPLWKTVGGLSTKKELSPDPAIPLLGIYREKTIILFYYFFCLFAFSRAVPTANGGSQARGLIGAVATSLRQSHSNAGSESRLQPTPQFRTTPDPYPTEQGQGSNPQPHGS